MYLLILFPFLFAVTFMKLGDITKRYNKPCIMDVKMGAITWDPEADADKIHREKAKYPYADEIGFHLLGMRVSGTIFV